MAHVLTGGEKTTQRLSKQWSKSRLIVPQFATVYSARLDTLPTSFDMVSEIDFIEGVGNIADVLPDMALYVGTTLGGYDLGMCRIRKITTAGCLEDGTLYLGEVSEVVWQADCYLTVVTDYQIWAKPLRIVSQVPYMDFDIGYSDQHEDFDPVAVMGTDKVAKLTSASVDILLGPSSDVPPWVIASTIVSQQWSYTGPAGLTFDDDTALNPTATAIHTGTYVLYCEFTADNEKSYTGVRYLVVWNDLDPHLLGFSVRNGRMNYDTGACSFDVVLYNQFDVTSLRKRSKIILATEDFANHHAVVMPGQIPGSENILCEGWVSNIDTSRQSEYGEISFTVESAEFWMKKVRDYPSGLEFKTGTAAAWTDMPLLGVQRAAWHFLHWRSTVTRVMDVSIQEDPRYATRFNIMRANLWERVDQVIQNTIHASMGIDNFGRLFVQIDPQMVPVDDRDFPVVMELTDDDIEDNISWRRRDVNEISMLFYSGVAINATGGASSYFAMSPGHSYGHYGDEEPQDNYLVSSQAQAIEACGLYYGWKNNDPYDLEIDFIPSMRILGMFPRQYFYYEVSAENDPRGIGFAKNWIVREINFSQEVDGGFIKFSANLEPESLPGPAIKGDIPSMENIDFSIPKLPKLPGLPALPALPIIALPPTELNPDQPKKVVIASSTHGVFYTENFNADDLDIEWLSMNNGLGMDQYSSILKLMQTPSGALFIFCDSNVGRQILTAAGPGGAWTLLADGTELGGSIISMGKNPNDNESIAFLAGGSDPSGDMTFYVGSRSGYTAGYAPIAYREEFIGDIVFSNGLWIAPASLDGVFATPYMVSFSPDGATVINGNSISTAVGQDAAARFMSPMGTQDKIFQWDSSGAGGYNLLTVGGTIATRYTGISPAKNYQGMAFSPTGTHAMGADQNILVVPYKTTDGGATWVSVSATIPDGSDIWESCRDLNRWIFGGGIILRLTMDQGDTYIDKYVKLSQVAPLIDITQICYIE